MARFQYKAVWLIILLMLQLAGVHAHARDFDAVLYWAEIHMVNFPMDGSIRHVHVRPGEKVSTGSKLVELDKEPIAIRIRQYEAELAAGKPVLADARRAFEQAQSLYEQTVLSDDELQRARHAFEKAGAEQAAARARLDYARWQLRKAEALAPWDARVVQRDAEPGQMLVAEQRSKPLLVLAKAGVMGASAIVPVASVKAIRPGQPVSVRIEDTTVSATVSAIARHSGTDASEVLYRVDAVFPMTAETFLAGQAVTIKLP